MFLLAFGRNINDLNYSSLGLDSDFRLNIYYLNYVLFVAFLVWIVWISRVYEQDDFLSPSAARRYLDYLNYSSSLGLDSDFRLNIYYLNYVLFVAFLVWIVWISRVYEQDGLCVS